MSGLTVGDELQHVAGDIQDFFIRLVLSKDVWSYLCLDGIMKADFVVHTVVKGVDVIMDCNLDNLCLIIVVIG